MKHIFKFTAILASAALLSILSANITNIGPEYELYCNLGKSSDGIDITCPERVLKGGWPSPFLYDTPFISVQRSLGFEDSFRLSPFIANIAFYIIIISVFMRLLNITRDKFYKK